MDKIFTLWKPCEKLFTKGVLSSGYGFNTPQTGSVCEIKVVSDEASLLSCLQDQIKKITIGDADEPMYQVLEDCIRNMKEGEECIVQFQHQNMGSDDAKEVSYSSKKIQFKLLSFTSQPEIWEMSVTDKWDKARYHKQRGLELYVRREYEYAFRHFSLTLKYIISLENGIASGLENMDVDELKHSSYQNLAACQFKHNNFESVVINSTKSLNLKNNNVKALYRRGTAYIHLQEYEKAEKDLIAAQKLEPNNQAVTKNLQDLKNRIQKLNQYYASAMKKMFS